MCTDVPVVPTRDRAPDLRCRLGNASNMVLGGLPETCLRFDMEHVSIAGKTFAARLDQLDFLCFGLLAVDSTGVLQREMVSRLN
jgi:hypothetical protein